MSTVKSLTLTIIPSDLEIKERFHKALSTKFNETDSAMIANAVGEYPELRILLDDETDENRKAFKMSVDKKTRDFLKQNKLHRVIIANMLLYIDMFDLIEELDVYLDKEMTEIHTVIDVSNGPSKYNLWNKQERLDFVNNKVTPFATKFCEAFIQKCS